MIKKILNKENLKTVAKEGDSLGAEVVTETAKGFINGIFYKIVFTLVLAFTLLIGGSIGSQIIVDKFTKTESKWKQ